MPWCVRVYSVSAYSAAIAEAERATYESSNACVVLGYVSYVFATGGRFSRIIYFPLKLGYTRGHRIRTWPHTGCPTPWGGSPTPRRMLGVPPDGWGHTNSCIWPWGCVAKMGVLQEISRITGKTTETGLHEDTALELGPTPHPTPWGGSPPPNAWWASPPMDGVHQWAYRALGMGGQNGCPAENFLPHSYHGQYQGFPYHTISYQFTIVKRYCTGQWTKS
jgi:hypothetical protein